MAKQRAAAAKRELNQKQTATRTETTREKGQLKHANETKGAKNVNAFAHINETRSCVYGRAHTHIYIKKKRRPEGVARVLMHQLQR